MSTFTTLLPQPRPVPANSPPPLGLVLFIEVDEGQAADSGTTVIELAEVLREFAQELVPQAETSTAVALAASTEIGTHLVAVKGALAKASHHDGDSLQVDATARVATVDGIELDLTFREFELLAFLVRNRGRAITREEFIAAIWAANNLASNRTVDVHIRRLRAKLGKHGSRIATLRGHGYRFD